MLVEALVTLNDGTAEPKKKLWHLFGPVKGLIYIYVAYLSLT